MGCHISLITGVLAGFELDETDEFNFLVVALFIIQLTFQWDKK
jgi:hypothetical protein